MLPQIFIYVLSEICFTNYLFDTDIVKSYCTWDNDTDKQEIYSSFTNIHRIAYTRREDNKIKIISVLRT